MTTVIDTVSAYINIDYDIEYTTIINTLATKFNTNLVDEILSHDMETAEQRYRHETLFLSLLGGELKKIGEEQMRVMAHLSYHIRSEIDRMVFMNSYGDIPDRLIRPYMYYIAFHLSQMNMRDTLRVHVVNLLIDRLLKVINLISLTNNTSHFYLMEDIVRGSIGKIRAHYDSFV